MYSLNQITFQNVLLCIFAMFWKQHWGYWTSMFQLWSLDWNCLFRWHFGRLKREKNKSLYFLCSGNTFTNNNFSLLHVSVFFCYFPSFFCWHVQNIWIPFGNYTSSQKNYILNKTHAALHFQKISNFKIPVLKFYNRAAV